MKPKQFFTTEAALCAAFAEAAIATGWKVYNETAGWDQLLVNANGEQAGIQAKLRGNLKVIYQALDVGVAEPDWRCVLVERRDHGFNFICHHCRLMVFAPDYDGKFRLDRLPSCGVSIRSDPTDGLWEKMRWPTQRRCSIPAYVPDVPAGVPSPIQLTEWKIKAIRLCCILRSKGVLTRADFREAKVDPQRWFVGSTRWLRHVDMKRGVYAMVEGARLPDEDHPVVAAQIAAELAAAEVA